MSATRRYSPYPAYSKATVAPNRLPANWTEKSVKHVATINDDALPENTNPDRIIQYVDISNVTEIGGIKGASNMTFESAPSRARRLVKHGDVIISTVRTYLRAIATIIDPPQNMVVSTGFAVVRPREMITHSYLSFALHSQEFVDAVVKHSEGVNYPAITPSQLARLKIPLPPIRDQRSVATLLDRETSKIDALIQKKQRLIELLNEKRAALISHAVTKGLDPSVAMRPSGVEWIGEIPRSWEVLHLRRIVQRFIDYRGKTPEKTSAGIPLVTAKNIKAGVVDYAVSREYISEETYRAWMMRGFPAEGDVLLTTEAPLGDVAQVTDPGIALAQRIILLKGNDSRIMNDFLRYYLMGGAGGAELYSRATGSTAIGIKASHLRSILIAVPSLEEQAAIVTYLNSQLARTEAPISAIRTVIDRLQEYRAALISAAVTGQIDVRDEV